MRSTSHPKARRNEANGLQPEYRFDYTSVKPNRFANRVRPGSVAVLLDPDVARVFQNAESVNTVLRALLYDAGPPYARDPLKMNCVTSIVAL
jgi:hypothetical protein